MACHVVIALLRCTWCFVAHGSPDRTPGVTVVRGRAQHSDPIHGHDMSVPLQLSDPAPPVANPPADPHANQKPAGLNCATQASAL